MSERVYGAKYEKDLGTVEIAARFRADVKAAIAAGDLPKGLKLSVTVDKYSGGSSIRVAVKAAPFRVMSAAYILDEEQARWTFADGDGRVGHVKRYAWHTRKAVILHERLTAMLAAYNHDGSDSMTDHFDVKFYVHVDVGGELERVERDAIRADETLLSLAAAVRADEPGASDRLLYYLAKQYGETLCGDEAAAERARS